MLLTLSTPRSGVGTCDNANVIALDGDAPDVQSMVQLPQGIKMRTPDPIVPAPPLTDYDLKKTGGCPAGSPVECTNAGDVITFTPVGLTPVQLGNVVMNAQAEVHLKAGIYEVNSLQIAGNAVVSIDSGPVVFRIAGKDASGNDLASPIIINGGGLVNGAKVPKNLQFVYGGKGDIQINGGSNNSFLTYAPNASITINGGAEMYGALVGAKIKDMGKAKIHYDRQLGGWALTEGNPTMTSFSWSSSS